MTVFFMSFARKFAIDAVVALQQFSFMISELKD